MGRAAITYDIVLKSLNDKLKWIEYGPVVSNTQTTVTFKDFRKILLRDKITTSERKVNELWDLMVDLDFFKRINKSQVRIVHLCEVADALGYDVVDNDSVFETESETSETKETYA